MNSENKICQNCKKDFIIEPEDFDFYEKMKVPAPTWCPECRTQRRMAWWNEHYLFRTKDAVSGKEILSGTDDFSGAKAVDKDYWYSDNWDQNASGRDYDFSKPFFLQFKELLKSAPIPSRFILNNVDSEYCNNVGYLKNCYLCFGCTIAEDSAFSDNVTMGKQIFDSSYITDDEISYESMFNKKCYRAFYSQYCEDSFDIYFCRDCVGCSDCSGCVNLRNKKYYIFNKPFSKEDYKKEIKKLNLHKYSVINLLCDKARNFWGQFPIRYVRGRKNDNCSGEYISNSKNVRQSYYVNDGENLKYCQGLYAKGGKDSYDHFRFGLNTELIYECTTAGNNTVRTKFCMEAFNNSQDSQYCVVINNCSNCFGCVGLRQKQYCILNKQYTKEEYEELVPKIIAHMNAMPYIDKKQRVYKYGEFFPSEISLYPYNDTVAQDFFPLAEAEAVEKGFAWRKPEKREYNVEIEWNKLPDSILDVKDGDFENKIISCKNAKTTDQRYISHCATAFKLTGQELQFYHAHNIPLPRFCPNCRYLARISLRNPMHLWHRKCMKAGCENEFETSYAPERPEIVYCESCYQQEVA